MLHTIVVRRAIDAVDRVEREFRSMQRKGDLKEFNASFKAARAIDPSLRYLDFVHTKKTATLEALAVV
jgi:hypothetical protein